MTVYNINNIKLGVIGCGKMASAILEGVVNNNFIQNKNIFIYDVNGEASKNLANKFDFNIANSIKEILNSSNILLLAIKPFVVDEVLKEIKNYYNNHLVMSIVAGAKIEKYKSYIENIKIVRIMPNTPALVNLGMSAICEDGADKNSVEFAYNFMKNCGEAITTQEDKMDIITALSGSGPAFYYKIIDLMANAAQKLGLNYNEALLLSAQTALGSAKMILNRGDIEVSQLIKNVTTPGGCTEVGNNVLNSSDIDKIIDKTIKDTIQKAHDLG